MDTPLEEKKSSSAKKEFSIEVIQTICALGFSEAEAKYALGQTDGVPDRAVDYLFNHPEVAELVNQGGEHQKKNPYEQALQECKEPKYKLKGIL